jgi:hypothetical protein
MYRFANGNVCLQYGQGNYANMTLAKTGARLEEYILNPALANAEFFGWWFIESTATNTGGTTLTAFVEYTIGTQGGTSSSLAGAMLKGDNGAGYLDYAAVRANFGLGTAAVTDATAYATAAQGTKVDGIEANANNYTHPSAHAISFITGLQTALDGKVDDSQVLTNVPSGALFTDTNTTYSVQDGELSQNNFTNADHTKLDGIAASANNYSHPAAHDISFITGLQTALDGKVDDSQVLTNVPSGALFSDNNTTYSVQDGELSQNNFTDADHNKLNNIEDSANNYSHPAAHAISFITGLQTALDDKVDDSRVLTNVPSGAVFTDTTYSVGNGGLTQQNFTNADHTKLNGIAASANNYVLPSDVKTQSIVTTAPANGTGFAAGHVWYVV